MTTKRLKLPAALITAAAMASTAHAIDYDLSWHTIDGGGGTVSGGAYELSGTLGQHDAGTMIGPGAPGYELAGGFWPGAAPAGTGVPAATATAAVSRKPNAGGPGGVCDTSLLPGPGTEPHQGGVSEVRIAFDVAPGGPGSNPVTIEQATCAAPSYAPYSGSSAVSGSVAGNTLVLTFSPALENARRYKLTVGAEVTSIAGQFVEVRGMVGDANSDGSVNATDRSVVVGAWTGGGFTCASDVNRDGATNATDRSIVVGAWTGGQNCAP